MSRVTYYLNRGRVARNCWTCDNARCKCRTREAKRSARHVWRTRVLPAEIAEEFQP